jgi:glycosyltransferase involved in cell wall biosynthesis
MTTTPKITVVTPSYQQAEYLEQTIQSVISQNIEGLEYIITDGGSKDGSVDIIRKYEPYLAWWVSEKDNGQAEAVNKGLQHASGEIIAWINSDDYFLPGTLAFVLDYFETHPEIGLIFGDLLAVDENGATINLIRYSDWGLQDLMRFEIVGQPSIFFRRSVLERSGLMDVSFDLLMDHQFWLKIASITPIKYIPRTLSAARYHSKAKNMSKGALYAEDTFRIVDWMKTEPNLKGLWEKNQTQILAGAYHLSAFYITEGKQWKQAVTSYLHCFWLKPAYIGRDWRRFLYALLNLCGLGFLNTLAFNLRDRKRYENIHSTREE